MTRHVLLLRSRALSALAIAALTATALVASAPPAPSAALRLRDSDGYCAPNHAKRISNEGSLFVGNREAKDVAVRPGDVIRVMNDASASLCLLGRAVRCDLDAPSNVTVLPPNAPAVILKSAGDVEGYCKARDTGKRQELRVGGETIRLGALGLKSSQRPKYLAGGAASPPSGHLFSLTAHGGTVVMRVQRGATIVGPSNRVDRGVVLGRFHQVRTRTTGAPPAPEAWTPNASEKAALAPLEALLPPDDGETTLKLNFDIIGPTAGSSLRSPVFQFIPTPRQSGLVFSCSLDDRNDFRVCADGQPVGQLKAGAAHHIFVTATDASGRTTERPERYDWSINANPIVYARGPAGGNTDIYVMESDGTGQKRLTDDSAHTRAPEWSPDHERIAFDSDVGGNADIYVMTRNGTDRRKLTADPAPDLNPTWSPDGKRIAFERRRPDGNRDIYSMSSDGSDVRQLTTDPADDLDPSWSPDGSRIVFASTRDNETSPEKFDIWIMDANGGRPRPLTKTPDQTEFAPSWSPDGELLAFHRKGIHVPNDIYVMKPDGSGVTRITSTGWDDQNPAWAPDGREIAFQSGRVAGGADSDIYFVSLDVFAAPGVRVETRLTTHAEYEYLPDW